MKKFAQLLTLTLLLSGTGTMLPFAGTEAEARPSTRSFTCEGVRDFVFDRGAVVMNHKSPSLYRRFVANRSYCDFEKVTKRYRVPTRSGSCTLLICIEPIWRRGN